MREFLDFAQRLLDIVRTAWVEHSEREGGIAHTDESDRQLILAYVHAYRRFRAIKRLAEDDQPSPEAVNVLTRSLVSLTHRALLHIEPSISSRQTIPRYERSGGSASCS